MITRALFVFGAVVSAQAAGAPAQDAGVILLDKTPNAVVRTIPVHAVKLRDGFWAARRDANVRISIPTLLKEFEDRGILDNFRRISGRKQVARRGPLYTDSDVYKWAEAVSFVLQSGDNPELRAKLDAVIDDIAAAQEPSGYINTYYSAEHRAERHTNMRHGHELYCGGHLIQAGIAHYRATGSRKLLDVGVKFADYVLANFGRDKKPIIEGHPEMEMALVELYRTTGDRKYLDFAHYMLESEPERIKLADRDLVYLFTGKPFQSRTQFEGHSVRAMYASSGATDYYLESGDKQYWQTLERLWADMAQRKVYITGGVGSRAQGEAFGEPYELPNQLAYTESCAAIANMFWNWRMLAATGDARYTDMVERALYNGVNSGMSLEGNLYCYRNPLELTGNPADKIRNPWYDTTCCPPNLERVFASLPGYVYGVAKDGLYVHLFHSSDLDWRLADGTPIRVAQTTGYPWQSDMTLKVSPASAKSFALYLRIPGWSERTQVSVNGKPVTEKAVAGEYLRLDRTWNPGDTVQVRFDLQPRLMAANVRVRDNIGKVAVERGPLVYCMEGADQTAPIWESALQLDASGNAQFAEEYRKDFLGGMTVLKARAAVRDEQSALYQRLGSTGASIKPAEVTLIPYYAFANRDATPMQVWIPYVRR